MSQLRKSSMNPELGDVEMKNDGAAVMSVLALVIWLLCPGRNNQEWAQYICSISVHLNISSRPLSLSNDSVCGAKLHYCNILPSLFMVSGIKRQSGIKCIILADSAIKTSILTAIYKYFIFVGLFMTLLSQNCIFNNGAFHTFFATNYNAMSRI